MLYLQKQEFGDTAHVLEETGLGVASAWVFEEGMPGRVMPQWNQRRNIGLIVTGEVYPGKPATLSAAPEEHRCREIWGDFLLRYESEGVEALESLNGTFAGIILDLRQSKLILFNDRFGLQRLYFHQNASGFYFASEAKVLLSIFPELRELDARGLGEFISCGCVMQNRTVFPGISLLPAGSAWVFEQGRLIEKGNYFRSESWEQQPVLTLPEYYERLKETWARILPRYLPEGERAALSLTGGVDSRMILAWAKTAPGGLPCYTFGGRYRNCQDVSISQKIARQCGQPHHVLAIDGEFLNRFPPLAKQTIYLSDGTMDVTGTIDLFVQQAAREVAPIRVTGTNGGEILRHLLAFKPMPLDVEVLAPEFLEHFRAASLTYAQELNCHPLSFTAFKQAPWYMCSKFVVERSGLRLRMPYFDNDLVKLVFQAPPEAIASNDVSLRMIVDGNPALARFATDRGVAFSPMAGVDRAKNLFQEFLFKAEYAYDYGMPQWLARLDHAAAPLHLERLFLGRHKFHHFRIFYRDELAGYVRDVLLDPRSLNRPYLRRSAVEKAVEGHLKGNRNYTLEIHKLLTLELIHRELIERDWKSDAENAETRGALAIQNA